MDIYWVLQEIWWELKTLSNHIIWGDIVPKVKDHIHALLGEGPVHATLIDPDRQSPKEAAEIASSAELGGTNLLLVGGTTGVDRSKMQSTIRSIKTVVRTPIVIFPAALESISDDADAILYISLMNSRNHEFVMRSAAMGSVEIQDSGIEPISTGYVVIDPGMLVGKIGDVDLIMRGDINSAVRYAVSAEMFGFCLFYLEGGSGVG